MRMGESREYDEKSHKNSKLYKRWKTLWEKKNKQERKIEDVHVARWAVLLN